MRYLGFGLQPQPAPWSLSLSEIDGGHPDGGRHVVRAVRFDRYRLQSYQPPCARLNFLRSVGAGMTWEQAVRSCFQGLTSWKLHGSKTWPKGQVSSGFLTIFCHCPSFSSEILVKDMVLVWKWSQKSFEASLTYLYPPVTHISTIEDELQDHFCQDNYGDCWRVHVPWRSIKRCHLQEFLWVQGQDQNRNYMVFAIQFGWSSSVFSSQLLHLDHVNSMMYTLAVNYIDLYCIFVRSFHLFARWHATHWSLPCQIKLVGFSFETERFTPINEAS